MATIQVRDVSEDAYEVIRRRARAAGQSMQAYLKHEIERLAKEPTDEEWFDEIERHVAERGTEVDRTQLLSDLDADRR